jgi:serine/threonine-protein kinase RsbW
MSAPHEHLDIELDGSHAGPERVRRVVADFLSPFGLSERTLYSVELVLEEWLTNTLRHGYDDPREARIGVHVWLEPDEVMLRFEDDGREFDPLLEPPVAPATSLADAKPGGLGLKMIRRVASRISHERYSERNHLTVGVSKQH